MSAIEQVELAIKDREGTTRGHIVLRLLPDARPTIPHAMIDCGPGYSETDIPPIQVLESYEYRYEIVVDRAGDDLHVTTDRPEILRPDTPQGLTGRFRTGLYTGTLPVTLFADGAAIGSFSVEVRSRKLDYLTHYEWMLGDLADTFAELIMRGFAPTQTRFSPIADADAPTLYQRFAFLKSMLDGPLFDRAIQQVIHHPHREWIDEQQLRPTGQAIPAGPAVARALTRGGRRVMLGGGPLEATFRGTAVRSLPTHIPVTRTHATKDTIPNRFVKYALLRWRDTVAEIETALQAAGDSYAIERGLRETATVLGQLDELLAQPLFRDVGPLTHLPAENQVLQKRAGYRELYRLFVQFELAAMLSWSGGDDVYGAGQKDVAVLYEYWVFLQLAQAISSLCDTSLPLERLLEVDQHGLDIRLRQGQGRVLKGNVDRLGRRLDVELWYNRTFPASAGEAGSWTERLRPDCSLRIRTPGYEGERDDIWLHFDAKYRLDSVREVFVESEIEKDPDATESESEGDPALEFNSEATPPEGQGPQTHVERPMAEDLIKMHAYRDAIRRSSGAYVIYPGTERRLRQRYHEVLPGLGAFALVPSEQAEAEGLNEIRQFIDDVLDHTALQITGHERHRYWERVVYRKRKPSAPVADSVPFLRRPPADTFVLLGYVRSAQQYGWIRREGLYNVRADQRTGSVGIQSDELGSEFVLLYGPSLNEAELWMVTDDPRILTRQRLLATGYASPGGNLYYCLPITSMETSSNPLRLDYDSVRRIITTSAPEAEYGAPVAVTWSELVRHADIPSPT